MTPTSKPPHRSVLIGIFSVSAATLLLEVVWLRVLSVTLWYHFAFLALSTAMFGFGLAAVVLSLIFSGDVPSKKFSEGAAMLTPVAFLIGFLVSNGIPFEPFSLGADPSQRIYLPIFFLSLTLPFFFSGLTILSQGARLATAFHRLYLFDLLGAGLGAVFAAGLLPVLGGAGTILFSAGLAAFGAVFICRNSGRRKILSGIAMSLLLFSASVAGERLVPIRISSDKVTGDGVPLGRLFQDPAHHLYTAWNSTSRVDVVTWQILPGQAERAVFIDGGAALTRLPHPPAAVNRLPPGTDEESFFYRLHAHPTVLIVGSGGGREVLLALRNNAARVTAVEINPDINYIASRLMADFTGHIFDDPRVFLYTDEARSFLNRTTDEFDVIHCPHTISNAAMALGSLSLSENYLMTVDAFRAYFAHLNPNGVLIITRPEAHLPRLFATLRAAAPSGAENSPGRRVIAWRARSPGLSFYAGVAYKTTPFSADETVRIRNLLARRGLDPVYLPGDQNASPYSELLNGTPFERIRLPFPTMLTPATDDMPFFNRRIPLSAVRLSDIAAVFTSGKRGRDALEDKPVTESALVVLLVEIVLLALFAVVLPTLVTRRKHPTTGPRARFNAAFFFLGLAFIFVEVGLIQRLTLYLGRPTIVYATVLSTLLVASGIGAVFAADTRFRRISPALLAAASGGVALVSLLLIVPAVHFSLQAPLLWRIVVTVLLILPPGFFMGMPFSTLIRVLGRTSPSDVALGLGINAVAGTVGTVIAVLIAMTLGQTAVLLCGIFCYAIVTLTLVGISTNTDFAEDSLCDK